jgi:hypothetical protein
MSDCGLLWSIMSYYGVDYVLLLDGTNPLKPSILPVCVVVWWYNGSRTVPRGTGIEQAARQKIKGVP